MGFEVLNFGMDVSAALAHLCHLQIHGLELLAVSAPRRIELHQHVLGVVDDERLKRVASDDFDGFRQVFRHVGLALDVDLMRREENNLKGKMVMK